MCSGRGAVRCLSAGARRRRRPPKVHGALPATSPKIPYSRPTQRPFSMKAAESPGEQTEDPPGQGWGESSGHRAARVVNAGLAVGAHPDDDVVQSLTSAGADRLVDLSARPGGSVVGGVDGDQHAELGSRRSAGRSGSLAACLNVDGGSQCDNIPSSDRRSHQVTMVPCHRGGPTLQTEDRPAPFERSGRRENLLEPRPATVTTSAAAATAERRVKYPTLASPCSAARGGSTDPICRQCCHGEQARRPGGRRGQPSSISPILRVGAGEHE